METSCPLTNPAPSDLFVGQLKSSLTCSHCGFCSTVFDPFWDLSLPIAKVSKHTLMTDGQRRSDPQQVKECLLMMRF